MTSKSPSERDRFPIAGRYVPQPNELFPDSFPAPIVLVPKSHTIINCTTLSSIEEGISRNVELATRLFIKRSQSRSAPLLRSIMPWGLFPGSGHLRLADLLTLTATAA